MQQIVIDLRLSTIRYADLIVVMDQGKIVESGNHESLLGKKANITIYTLHSMPDLQHN